MARAAPAARAAAPGRFVAAVATTSLVLRARPRACGCDCGRDRGFVVAPVGFHCRDHCLCGRDHGFGGRDKASQSRPRFLWSRPWFLCVVDCGVLLEVQQDQEAPILALQAVAAESCWAGVCPVDTHRHAERDEVEVHSSGFFVEYVEEQAHVLTDVG